MLTFWRHLYRQSVKTFYSNKITHLRCSNRILVEISSGDTDGGTRVFVEQPGRFLWMSQIMSMSNLSSSCGCIESNTECIHLDVRNSGVLENQENDDDRLRLDMNGEALETRSPELKACDAVKFELESEPPTEGSDSHSSQSPNIFDMSQIVEGVKRRVRKSRKSKKLQEKISAGSQFENYSFNLSSLFDESNLSCEDKRKEKEGKPQMCKNSSVTNQSDSDSFGLQSLFEGRKMENKVREKTRTIRSKKRKKHAADKKIKDESFGLELLFNENKGKRKRRRKILEEDSEENDDSGTEKHVVKRKKPNYFIAIRVSNPQIHLAVKDFQDSILNENEKLKPALIPLPSLHLTMGVMHLDVALKEIAKSALEKCKTSINDILKGINFKVGFLGVGNFSHEVVFAKVQEEKQTECLKTMNDVITATFQEEGICVDEGKEWKPHLTLLKLSRKPALRKRGIKKIKEDIYSSWTDSYFGEEQVEDVHLCSMFEPKEKDGFYKCVATISLDVGNEEEEEARQSQKDLSCTKLECEEETGEQ